MNKYTDKYFEIELTMGHHVTMGHFCCGVHT